MSIVCAFVGLEKSFDKPFGFGLSHCDARNYMKEELERYDLFISDHEPEFYGFIDITESGNFEILDRNEAFIKAKSYNQLKDKYQNSEVLQSYELSYLFNPGQERIDKLYSMCNKATEIYYKFVRNRG